MKPLTDYALEIYTPNLSASSSLEPSTTRTNTPFELSNVSTEEKHHSTENNSNLKGKNYLDEKQMADIPGCDQLVSDIENQFASIAAKARSTVEKYAQEALDCIDKKKDDTLDSKTASVNKNKSYKEVKSKFHLGDNDEDSSIYISLGPDPYFKSRSLSDNALVLKYRSKRNEDESIQQDD